MSDKTSVEWTRSASGPGASWNPFRGCDPVSPGCAHCYAAAVALRFSGVGMAFEGMAIRTARGSAQWTGVVRVIEDKMQEPLRWKRPRRIFAVSVSDPFHKAIPDVAIARMWAVMALAHWNHFQVLTKRAERMHQLLESADFINLILAQLPSLAEALPKKDRPEAIRRAIAALALWPLSNVTLGVSTEDQQRFDERWPFLRDTRAEVRMISWEPALGPLTLPPDALKPSARVWVVGGAESNQLGLPARPAEMQWFRASIHQCSIYGVAFFLKQLGSNPVALLSNVADTYYVAKKHKGKGGDWDVWPPDLRVRQYADNFDAPPAAMTAAAGA